MKSLQHQLSVLLGLSVLGVFVLFWWLSITTIHKVADDYVLTRLDHDTEAVIKNLHLDNGQWHLDIENIEPIYLHINSGHYFVIKVGNQTILSPSLNDYPLLLKSLRKTPLELLEYETQGPMISDGDTIKRSKLLVLASKKSKNNQAVYLYVAEDHSPIQESLTYFDWVFAIFAMSTLLLLYLLQKWILKRTFKQLTPIEQQLKNLEVTHQFNLDNSQYPKEVEPLIDALKSALQQASKQLKTSRESSANLSHGLKTPLNLAFQILEEITHDSSIENFQRSKQQMQQQLDKIHHLIDRSLKKARIASGSPLSNHFDFKTDFDELLQTLKQLYADQPIECDCAISNLPGLVIEKEDGFELFGNILDNAFKWAQHNILFKVTEVEGFTIIEIEDDGKGVSPEELDKLQTRGYRADESTPGHGIGLSIVKDLIEAYAGQLQFSHSKLGGLKVKLIFRPRS